MDEDFPDITGPSPGLLNQAQHASAWAQTFDKGTSNLMLRKKHKADIANATAMEAAAAEAHNQNELRTNKTAQDLYFRSEKLEMDRAANAAILRNREQAFQANKELQPKKLEAQDAAIRAANALEKSRTEGLRVKARLEERLAEHTSGFQSEVERALDSGVQIGSPEYTDAVTDALIKHPGADRQYADDIWKTTRVEMSMDDALKQRKIALQAAPDATVTTKLPGGATVTDRPVSAQIQKDRTLAATQLERAKTRKARAARDADEEALKEADEDIAEWSGKLAESEATLAGNRTGTPPVTASAERIATNPQTGQKLVLRNGAWVPLTP